MLPRKREDLEQSEELIVWRAKKNLDTAAGGKRTANGHT